MANGHGGDRVPANPAPVSGPGAMSQRTDGQGARYMSGGPYGEGQELMDLQTSAPMAKAPEASASRARSGRGAAPAADPGQAVTPLFAPTAKPDEPVTAGAPFGPGPGPSSPMTLNDESGQEAVMLKRYLPALESIANSEQGTPSFRRFVRFLKAAQ